MKMPRKKIKVSLIRSSIGIKKSHLGTLQGLGLRRLHSERILIETPEITGMLRKVSYLVLVSKF